MGDPFSIAVGALQVAEVGFKLCDTLHSSVRDFKNAEKDVKRVASEVKTASWALKQLGALLQQDEAIKRTKPGAISEASTALNQCSEAFAEVQVILPASGSSSTTSISAATRFKWATRKSKVDALLANLERLKTTLVLVFKVISYAKEIASSPKDSATDQMDMRFQLETLIKSKDEAVRRYEELVKSMNQTRLDDGSTNAFGPDSGSQSLNAGLNLMALPSNHAPPTQGNTNVKSTAPETNTGEKNCENLDLTKGLTEALADCHKAASGLSECLHIVHVQWRAVQKYDGEDIWKNYRLTDEAMRALEVVQAKSPEADPSSSQAQLRILQQQAQERKVQPDVPELFMGQALAAAPSSGKEKPAEPSKSKKRRATDDGSGLFGTDDMLIDCAPPSRKPPKSATSYSSGQTDCPFGLSSSHVSRNPRGGPRGGRSKPGNTEPSKRVPGNHYSKRLRTVDFSCQFCSLKFARTRNLSSHLRTHKEEKPFLCPVCEEGFASKHERTSHRALHRGEKTYVCKGTLASDEIWGCGGRYASPEEFYRHIRLEGRACIKPLWEEEIAMKREYYKTEDARRQQDPQADVTKVETEFPKTEDALPTTNQDLPIRLNIMFPDLAHIEDRSDISNPLSLSEDGARNDNVDIENDTDEGRSGKLLQEERDFLQNEKQCQAPKRKRKSSPGDAREQRAAKKPAKKPARDLAAKAAGEGLSGDAKESDKSRDPKRPPLGEKEVGLLIGAYESDHGERSTASHRKTDVLATHNKKDSTSRR
ncbi:hypothetical protein KC340_g6668 [Hortaea werneckii]|nr:hypothetical protein KC342_g6925 [Hortaea werneckii]KAI7098303.1 hypothetical protein KC339_g9055 [Hortaea werneckii]KAI7212667.1 hypothetical protein KC365_g14530 [Hortaea werneckii]KAI7323452.1 hypothetical protein KC340_g6668 [Hortaea werneckii]KAI7392497.1 hypothetical protein KC328_g7011 [Hortaea werneckii]